MYVKLKFMNRSAPNTDQTSMKLCKRKSLDSRNQHVFKKKEKLFRLYLSF